MGFSRRRFVECSCKSLAAVGATHFLRKFGMMNAYAQGVSDYKALVCVFLFGGNDGNNIVIPMDATGYADYAAARSFMAIAQNSVLPITASSVQAPYGSAAFGLHPALTDLQSMFSAGDLAVAANVGPLVRPTTRTQYLNRQVALPTNLFSHSDQQNEWQTAAANSLTSIGWGGRIADAMQYANAGAQYPMMVSMAGAPVFTNGNQSVPVTISAQNPSGGVTPPVTGVTCNTSTSGQGSTANCTSRRNVMQQVLTMDTGISLVQGASDTMTKAFLYTDLLNNARSGVAALSNSGEYVFPNAQGTPASFSLGNQLRQVAEIIQVRQALGVSRQIFFVSLGGFDTHSNQGTTETAVAATQPYLLAQLNAGLRAFWNSLGELGVRDNVTTFTLSDFARTLQPNTNNGTDHAWGNHQFVLGGAVQGGNIYGTFPTLKLGSLSPEDAGSNGRWIPTSSIDQFGAALASWFGVETANLPTIFPHLPNFNNQKMGFLG